MTNPDTNKLTGAAIGCRLLGKDFVARKEKIARDLFRHAEHVDELSDGYRFQFPNDIIWATRALEFIAAERQCCPFFTFDLVFEPNDGPIWLHLRGSEEIKSFVKLELESILPTKLSRAI